MGSQYSSVTSNVTDVTFFQFFYFHRATIKYLVDQSNKLKAYDDLGVQFYITTKSVLQNGVISCCCTSFSGRYSRYEKKDITFVA